MGHGLRKTRQTAEAAIQSPWVVGVYSLLLGVWVFGIAGALAAETDAQESIRKLLESQVAAWNRGDIDGFMQGYWKSRKTEFVGGNGVLRGWQAVLERYRRQYPDRQAMGTLTFSDLEITALGPDAAMALGRWRLTRKGDHPGGVFTLVLRKFPEGWRIIHDHTSASKE